MERIDRILARAFPDRDAFTPEEIAFAGAVLSASVESSVRSAMLPVKFVPVGGGIVIKGESYRCVRVSGVHHPSDACRGCDLASGYINCSALQCSPFDRQDGLFVWFVRE